jgi:hypothetical protein
MTIVLLALFAAWQTSGGAATSVQACTSAGLVGTWQVAYAKLGDQLSPTGPNDPVEYKHLTPTHFVVYQVTKDGTMNWAHGPVHAYRRHLHRNNSARLRRTFQRTGEGLRCFQVQHGGQGYMAHFR